MTAPGFQLKRTDGGTPTRSFDDLTLRPQFPHHMNEIYYCPELKEKPKPLIGRLLGSEHLPVKKGFVDDEFHQRGTASLAVAYREACVAGSLSDVRLVSTTLMKSSGSTDRKREGAPGTGTGTMNTRELRMWRRSGRGGMIWNTTIRSGNEGGVWEAKQV